jgi:hypothetical protein
MTHVDATIARIPGMTAQSRATLRRNAEAALAGFHHIRDARMAGEEAFAADPVQDAR